jgi:hypothetical protein
MGRAKQLQIELQDQERAEYRELKEMDLEDRIIKLKEEIEEKKDEMKSLKEDEYIQLEDIDMLKDEIVDLEKDLNENIELLERYKELSEIYHPVDIHNNDTDSSF